MKVDLDKQTTLELEVVIGGVSRSYDVFDIQTQISKLIKEKPSSDSIEQAKIIKKVCDLPKDVTVTQCFTLFKALEDAVTAFMSEKKIV